MARDKQLFGRNADEISELALDGVEMPVRDARHYAIQPTSAEKSDALANAPRGRFLEEVLKGSDGVKQGAKDAHPQENQPA